MRSLTLLVLAVVSAVFVSVGAATAALVWKPLERPLHLPALAPGQACPASKLAPAISGEKYGVDGAIGSGPVYPMLGRPGLLAFFGPATQFGQVWAGQKVLWFVRPGYTGPVLIRGRRLGGWQWMRFDNGTKPTDEIRIAPGETVTWTGQVAGSRGRPSFVRVRAPGCYAVQIDGTGFSTVVVFSVATERQ